MVPLQKASNRSGLPVAAQPVPPSGRWVFDNLLIEFADYSAVLDGLENELLHGYTSLAGITDLVSINTYLTFHPFPQRGL